MPNIMHNLQLADGCQYLVKVEVRVYVHFTRRWRNVTYLYIYTNMALEYVYLFGSVIFYSSACSQSVKYVLLMSTILQ